MQAVSYVDDVIHEDMIFFSKYELFVVFLDIFLDKFLFFQF